MCIVNLENRLFEQGRYAPLALNGNGSKWRTHAAKGMCALVDQAVEGLSSQDDEQAKFYLGAALWIGQREDEALKILRRCSFPAAVRLKRYIEGDPIRILALMPNGGNTPHVAICSAMSDPKFDVKNIASGYGPSFCQPDANVDDYCKDGWYPDLALSLMLEWHYIPKGLESLQCPVFGQSSDFDLHFHPVMAQLPFFDEVVVTADSEWRDCRGMTDRPISIYPKVFGIESHDLDNIQLKGLQRDIDVFFSGTVSHPYHPDKARLINELVDGVNAPMLVNGFINTQNYLSLSRRSKLTLSYYRHSCGLQTRALESLSVGTPVLTQPDNVIFLYVGSNNGLVVYDADTPGSLQGAIKKVMERPKYYEARAAKGSKEVLSAFDSSLVGSQYLRYLTVRAALLSEDGRRWLRKSSGCYNRRPVLGKGFLPGGEQEAARLAAVHEQAWSSVENQREANLSIAREIALLYAQQRFSGEGNDDLMRRVVSLLKHEWEKNCQRLVVGFNLLRWLVHFGSETDKKEILSLGNQLLSEDTDGICHPEDDIWPYDLFSEYFDYRTYQDALIRWSKGNGANEENTLLRCIRASASGYLAMVTDNTSRLRAAVKFNPEFPEYQLRLARRLIVDAVKGNRSEAQSILLHLVSRTNLQIEAYHLLRLHCWDDLAVDEQRRVKRHYRTFRRGFQERSVMSRAEQGRVMSPFISQTGSTDIWQRAGSSVDRPSDLLLYNNPDHEWDRDSGYPLELGSARQRTTIYWIEPFTLPWPGAQEYADVVIAQKQQGYDHHAHAAWNEALSIGHGRMVIVADSMAPIREEDIKSIEKTMMGADRTCPHRMIVVRPLSGDYGLDTDACINDFMDYICDVSKPKLVAFRRHDLLEFGGFDQALIYHGHAGGTYEMVARLLNWGAAWQVAGRDLTIGNKENGCWNGAAFWAPGKSKRIDPSWDNAIKALAYDWKYVNFQSKRLPISMGI